MVMSGLARCFAKNAGPSYSPSLATTLVHVLSARR